MRSSWLLLCVGLFSGGCHLDVSFADSHFYCGGGGSCPTGQACVQDYCVASEAPDASVDPDARPAPDAPPGTPDAAPPPDATPPCLLGNVADNFDTGAAAPFWDPFNESPTSVAESGGRLVVSLVAGTSGSHYAGYVYLTNTDGRGQHIQVEVPQVPNASGAANAFFKLQNGTNFDNEVTFIYEGGVIYMDTYDASYHRLSRQQINYSATNHRFWAFEESGGMVSFLTSPDGTNWTTRDTEPDPFPFQNARVALGGGTWRSESSPGGVAFDNLGMGPSTNCSGIAQ